MLSSSTSILLAVQVSDDLYFLAQAKHLLATRHAMTMTQELGLFGILL